MSRHTLTDGDVDHLVVKVRMAPQQRQVVLPGSLLFEHLAHFLAGVFVERNAKNSTRRKVQPVSEVKVVRQVVLHVLRELLTHDRLDRLLQKMGG